MQLFASSGRNRFINLFDANGVRLERVIAADTESGMVRTIAVNSFGDYLRIGGEIAECWDFYPAPLRVFDTRLNMEITSQSQLDFLECSRALAHAAHLRWKRTCERARLVFDDMAWKYGCKLGNPTFDTAWMNSIK